MLIAVIGLGEAGSLIAQGLANQGLKVVGFDPARPNILGIDQLTSAEDAACDADVIFSINSSSAAIKVAQSVGTVMKQGALYCDLNTSTPALKSRLADMLPAGCFVDVAVMKPVPGLAEKVPMSISGEGAIRLKQMFEQYDVNFSYVSDVPGEAAARKLLRSMFAKGMAAVIIDYLWAAKEMGLQDWAIEEVMSEFDSSDRTTVQRYLSGTAKHAKRRSVEMADVVSMLSEIGYDSTMVGPIELTLNRIIHSKKVPFSDIGN